MIKFKEKNHSVNLYIKNQIRKAKNEYEALYV